MKIHVLGVPHTQSSERFTSCAFTQKVVNLCKMMHRRGHEVLHYGVEGSEVECSEDVAVVSKAEWEALYPHPGKGFYNLNCDGIYAPYHAKWAAECKKAITARSGAPHTEIACLTWGGTQRTACEGLQQFLVESGIGYKIAWSNWRVYESYAWLHMHLGEAGLYQGDKWYWAVIPNAFDLSKFAVAEKRGEDFLYLGRLNDDKGVGLAVHIARAVGRRLVICGQGDPAPYLAGNPHVSYHEPVDAEGRRELFGKAAAVLCPTRYVEPFCGVNVEAQISGCPVITTDWGAFSETVLHGVTGYRCRSFEQFVWAAQNVHKLHSKDCAAWARDNYSLERVARMYEEYFQMVLNVRREGFYIENPARQDLEWLRRVVDVDADAPLDLSSPHAPPPEPKANGVSAPATAVVAPVSDAEWQEAQAFERSWWGLEWAPNWDEELKKQQTYFRLMGMPEPAPPLTTGLSADRAKRDFGTKSILDVGCGPVSLLQRSVHGRARGVDPLAVSEETRKRYEAAGVEFLNVRAEDMPVDEVFDEVWMYNCLQHTQDPHAILTKVAQMGREVRIFEWIDLGVCPGHPQVLTEEMFWQHFGGPEWERPIWNVGNLRDFGGTVTNKYLAIHAIAKGPKVAMLSEVERLRDRVRALEAQIRA